MCQHLVRQYKFPKQLLAEGTGFRSVYGVPEKSCIQLGLGTSVEREMSKFGAQGQRVTPVFGFPRQSFQGSESPLLTACGLELV